MGTGLGPSMNVSPTLTASGLSFELSAFKIEVAEHSRTRTIDTGQHISNGKSRRGFRTMTSIGHIYEERWYIPHGSDKSAMPRMAAEHTFHVKSHPGLKIIH